MAYRLLMHCMDDALVWNQMSKLLFKEKLLTVVNIL